MFYATLRKNINIIHLFYYQRNDNTWIDIFLFDKTIKNQRGKFRVSFT